MFQYLNISSIPMPSNTKEWLEAYKKILINTIYFGLFLFIGGIYIFPNDSGTQQVFYLLITLPFLLLFPFVVKELPWKSKYLYIYMAFPMYMFVSHFWAPMENVSRGWFFFFRQLICFFVLISIVSILMSTKKRLIDKLVIFLVVTGFLSAIVSLGHFYFETSRYWWITQLRGFSILDVDKAGAIYGMHFGFCLFAYLFLEGAKDKKLIRLFLIFAMTVDIVAVYFVKTTGSWLIVLVTVVILLLLMIKNRVHSFCLLGLFVAAVFIAVLSLIAFDYGLDKHSEVRVELVAAALNQWLENIFFGMGLSYKSPVAIESQPDNIVHTHNIFADILRFSGVTGLGFCLLHIFVPNLKFWFCDYQKKQSSFLLNWFFIGILAASLYGQQPFVRPGSYMWFFYWIPLALQTSRLIWSQDALEKKMVKP